MSQQRKARVNDLTIVVYVSSWRQAAHGCKSRLEVVKLFEICDEFEEFAFLAWVIAREAVIFIQALSKGIPFSEQQVCQARVGLTRVFQFLGSREGRCRGLGDLSEVLIAAATLLAGKASQSNQPVL